MRQIFSVRFFAAVGAVVALAALWFVVFGQSDPVEEVVEAEPPARRINLVAPIFAVAGDDFSVERGVSTGTLDLALDLERQLRIVEGTHGEVDCEGFATGSRCAIVADLLGEAVVWFAVVPLESNRTVHMPAIVALEGELATLDNGWQVPYADILDRRCAEEFGSFREFREELGTRFTSIYDLDEQQLTAVECDAG